MLASYTQPRPEILTSTQKNDSKVLSPSALVKMLFWGDRVFLSACVPLFISSVVTTKGSSFLSTCLLCEGLFWFHGGNELIT